MRNATVLFFLVTALSLALNGCGINASPVATPAALTPTSIPPTPIPISPIPTATSIPKGKKITVTSADDSGSGTLRQSLLDAEVGDTITFDPLVFLSNDPVAIQLLSGLPSITQGYLTLDASNAGVILDGTQAGGEWTAGIELNSEHNVIQGLQVVHFSGPGVLLDPDARFNLVGGDRTLGTGPLGHGNLFSDTSDGVGIKGSDNIITGNLIGTNSTGLGKMGNRAPGIFLEENASHNVIGPNNIIAYNGTVGGGGVEIRSMNAQANTITENSIHDNSFAGIYYNLSDGVQIEFSATAYILDFDLAAGTAAGMTCPDCIVEIFSTSGTDGEIYEGTTTADRSGNFSFNKGQAFAGPSLTATSRSAESNTSEFSVPTLGPRRVLKLQEENESPRSIFEAKSGKELGDNRIGQLFDKLYLLGDLQEILNTEILGLGTKYVKLTITEAEALTTSGPLEEPVRWDISEFSFDPAYEDFITKLAENGINVDYILTFWDKANHPQGWQPEVSRFRTQAEIDHYLEYVRFIVNHFKGRVKYYEIWNEPDNRTPLQWIQPEDYINLVSQIVPVIRSEDPEAKIVVGSVVLQDPQGRDYLFEILNSDIMPMVDVVAWHPLFGVSPENVQLRQYYYDYPSIVGQIKDAASKNGFQGTYRADEVTYRSPDCFWCSPSDISNTNITAAKYYARGIVLNLGMDLGVGAGGESSLRKESYAIVRNLCTLMVGAKVESLPLEIQSQATNIRSYAFSFPNGEHLLALWADGVAVDDDLGVVSTLNITGFSDWNATGIDILNSIEQKLITEDENGNLIIPDFLVKDYPIVIRLSK
jgi:hypothetical protein